jgi:O-antigen/teichoic acid export membrane protein
LSIPTPQASQEPSPEPGASKRFGWLRSRLLRSRIARQAGIFTGSSVAGAGLAALSTAVLARQLSTQAFGNFAFAKAVLPFIALFFELGFFIPAARLVAGTNDVREKREVIGAALVTFVPIGVAFSVFVFGLSFVLDDLFNFDAQGAVRAAALLGFVYPFQIIGSELARGADRLHTYSICALVGAAAFLGFLLVAPLVGLEMTVTAALVLRGIAYLIGSCLLVAWLTPLFRNVRRHVQVLARHSREYGFQVYIGGVMAVATYQMDIPLLGVFVEPREVGFYALAQAVCMAVGLPIYGMAYALFPRMMGQLFIDRRWLVIAWTVGLAGAATLSLLATPLISLAFSDRYMAAAPLILPLSLAEAVRGATTVYNGFLQARGRGKDLRNAGFVLMGSNLILNFSLIPALGTHGAALASLFALLANLLAHMFFYRRAIEQRGDPATV